ncbi:MAG: SUMF1/EgtB/PvdO family nonheme iron enzyme [Verrucomicrobiota bacterium]
MKPFSILFFITALCFALTANAAERVALVIGINDYKHADPLENAVNDALAVADMLENQLGFTLVKPKSRNLFNRSQGGIWKDVGVDEFYQGLDEFKKAAATAEIGLIYFAGHGIEVDSKNYLVPGDAELENVSSLRSQAIRIGDVLADLKETQLPSKLLILDCCRNNPLQRSWRNSRSTTQDGLAEIKDGDIPEATMILFSASPGKPALDGTGDNSPFTSALIDELPKPGRTAFDAFLKVCDTVVVDTGKRQEPWLKFDGAGRNFRDFQFVEGAASEAVSGAGEELAALRQKIAEMEAAMANQSENSSRVTELQAELERMKQEVRSKPSVEPTMEANEFPTSSESRMQGTKAGEQREFAGIKFRWCPPGTFQMGSPSSEPNRSDDEKQHMVTLTKGFWIAETECTQAEWQRVMGSNPSRFSGSDRPVEEVSWEDAQEYLSKLNQANSFSGGWKFNLPTEAQWEYACRAGTTTAYAFGSSLSSSEANFDENVDETTSARKYPANKWGIYDMHGNVWEWCRDWYGEDYYVEGQRDPQGPSDGSNRVLRGGGWSSFDHFCRSAYRIGITPDYRGNDLGFRLALSSN